MLRYGPPMLRHAVVILALRTLLEPPSPAAASPLEDTALSGSHVFTGITQPHGTAIYLNPAAIGMAGVGWQLEFDLGGTGTLEMLRLWCGKLAAIPSGVAFAYGSDAVPAASLVDATGWTELVNTGLIIGEPGQKSYPISGDLASYDVMVIKVKAKGNGVGTTYDNFTFVAPEPHPPTGVTIIVR